MKTARKILALGLRAKKAEKVPVRWRSLNPDQEKAMRQVIGELKDWHKQDQVWRNEAQKANERSLKALAKIREKAGGIPGGFKRVKKQAGIE